MMLKARGRGYPPVYGGFALPSGPGSSLQAFEIIAQSVPCVSLLIALFWTPSSSEQHAVLLDVGFGRFYLEDILSRGLNLVPSFLTPLRSVWFVQVFLCVTRQALVCKVFIFFLCEYVGDDFGLMSRIRKWLMVLLD